MYQKHYILTPILKQLNDQLSDEYLYHRTKIQMSLQSNAQQPKT